MVICEHLEHVMADPTVTVFSSDLKKLLNYEGGPGLVVAHVSFSLRVFDVIEFIVSVIVFVCILVLCWV